MTDCWYRVSQVQSDHFQESIPSVQAYPDVLIRTDHGVEWGSSIDGSSRRILSHVNSPSVPYLDPQLGTGHPVHAYLVGPVLPNRYLDPKVEEMREIEE